MCVGHLKIFLVQKILWHLICFYYSLVPPTLRAVTTAHLSSWWLPCLCTVAAEVRQSPCAGSAPQQLGEGSKDHLSCTAVLPGRQNRLSNSSPQLCLSCPSFCPTTKQGKLTGHVGLVCGSVTDATQRRVYYFPRSSQQPVFLGFSANWGSQQREIW